MAYQSFVGSNVLVIGDSHTALWPLMTGTKQYDRYDVNADPGRSSAVAYSILADVLRPRHTKVVFDIATNDWRDPATFRYNLKRVWDLIGRDRALVLVTGFWPGNLVKPVNSIIRDFAAGKTRVEVVKWIQFVQSNPAVIADAPGEGPWPDGIHFTWIGYALRAGMVKDAVRASQPRGD